MNCRTWYDELTYIERIAATQDFKSFNNDAHCFARYCDMQARGARKDGEYTTAETMNRIACEIVGQEARH